MLDFTITLLCGKRTGKGKNGPMVGCRRKYLVVLCYDLFVCGLHSHLFSYGSLCNS